MPPSFIEDYETYVAPLEVPQIFNVWCSLFAISVAAQRKLWIELAQLRIAPSLYVVLDAEPGIGKDTAMNIVKNDLLAYVKGVNVKYDSITKEKIYSFMAECAVVAEFGRGRAMMQHSSIAIFASEMSVLFKAKDRDFVGAMNMLYNTTDIYQYSTKGQGEFSISFPYVSMLAGTTPDWVARNMEEDLIAGGFSARALFVYAASKSQLNHKPVLTPDAVLARARMIRRLEEIVLLKGTFIFTPQADKFYEGWYYPHYKTKPKNPKLKDYHERKKVHLLKLSMLYCLARSDDLEINQEDMERALATLNLTEPGMDEAFANVGRGSLDPIAEGILHQVKNSKTVSLVNLYVSNKHNFQRPDDFKEVLRNLQTSGLIKVVVDQTDPKRTQIVYIEREEAK